MDPLSMEKAMIKNMFERTGRSIDKLCFGLMKTLKNE